MTGAAMTIGCGILYMFSQTALSYKMADTISISRLRLIMAVVCSLTAASCILHVNHRHRICFKSPNRQKTLLVLANFLSMYAIILIGYWNVIDIYLVIWKDFMIRKWVHLYILRGRLLIFCWLYLLVHYTFKTVNKGGGNVWIWIIFLMFL